MFILVNGSWEEGDNTLLWPGDTAGYSVTGLWPVTAYVGWLVPHQHNQSRRRGRERLAYLGHYSLQVRKAAGLMTDGVCLHRYCLYLILFAVTLKKKDRLTEIKRGYLSMEIGWANFKWKNSSFNKTIYSIHTFKTNWKMIYSCSGWMLFSPSDGLEPTKTSLLPPGAQESSIVSYSSTILATHRSVQSIYTSSVIITRMLSTALFQCHIILSSTASGDRIGYSRIRPQLASHSPTVCDWQRQETKLLDDRNVDICTALSMVDN